MGDAYITLWSQPQIEVERRRALGEDRLTHAANGQFRKSGVGPDDRVYVVGTRDGELLLLGRLKVDRVVGQREAEAFFRHEVYKAPDHLIGQGSRLELDRAVPEQVARRIERESGKGLKIETDRYRVDANSLRTTGRITAASAALLDDIIGA